MQHNLIMSFVFHFYILIRLNEPFTWRTEMWEPFKMRLIWGLQSWTLLTRIITGNRIHPSFALTPARCHTATQHPKGTLPLRIMRYFLRKSGFYFLFFPSPMPCHPARLIKASDTGTCMSLNKYLYRTRVIHCRRFQKFSPLYFESNNSSVGEQLQQVNAIPVLCLIPSGFVNPNQMHPSYSNRAAYITCRNASNRLQSGCTESNLIATKCPTAAYNHVSPPTHASARIPQSQFPTFIQLLPITSSTCIQLATIVSGTRRKTVGFQCPR